MTLTVAAAVDVGGHSASVSFTRYARRLISPVTRGRRGGRGPSSSGLRDPRQAQDTIRPPAHLFKFVLEEGSALRLRPQAPPVAIALQLPENGAHVLWSSVQAHRYVYRVRATMQRSRIPRARRLPAPLPSCVHDRRADFDVSTLARAREPVTSPATCELIMAHKHPPMPVLGGITSPVEWRDIDKCLPSVGGCTHARMVHDECTLRRYT